MKKKPRRFVIWNLRGCPLIFCYDIVTVRRLKRNDFAKKRRRSALCRMPACDRYDFCRKPPCKIIKTCRRRRTKESRKQTCRRARAPEGATNKRRRRTTYLQPAAALLRAVNVIFHGLGTGFDIFVLEGFEDVAVFFENGLQVIIFVDRFCAFVLEKVLV